MKGSKLIILAAGNSSRMKVPKALLTLPHTNATFVETIVKTYTAIGIENIIIVSSTSLSVELERLFHKKNIKIITNNSQQLERMYSIFLGIKEVDNNDCVFIQDCDNPFITTDTIKTLYENKNSADYIVPSYNSKSGHPVLLGPEVVKYIQSLNTISENDTLKNILQKFTRKEVDVSSNTIHININSPELYQQLILGSSII